MAQDASNHIKTAICNKLYNDFSVSNVPGLSSKPLFIQDKPIPGLNDPYVYVTVQRTSEVDKTKVGSSRDYFVRCLVVTKATPTTSTEVLRDDISAEVVRLLDAPEADYLDIGDHGHDIYMQNASVSGRRNNVSNMGATFFLANIEVVIRAQYSGFSDAQPVGSQSFTFSGFEHSPSGLNIEDHDAGTITVSDSHGNSNGWTFSSVSVSKSSGHTDGSLDGRVLTVSADDENIGITSTFTFTKDGETATATDTDNFNRIKSLRFGTGTTKLTSSATFDLTDLSEWNIDYGTVNPNAEEITVTVDQGEYIYIIMDEDYTLSAVDEDVFNRNILTDVFESSFTRDGYRIYSSKNSGNYDNTEYTYTLRT